MAGQIGVVNLDLLKTECVEISLYIQIVKMSFGSDRCC